MSIFDYVEQPKIEPETKPQEATKEEPKEKTIIVDGPLSTIYTKALDTIYAKKEVLTISKESQQQDTAIIKAVTLLKRNNEDNDKVHGKGVYVYVTDENELQSQDKVYETFDTLNIALGKSSLEELVLVIECHKTVTKNIQIIDDFARQQNVRIFYTRKAALDYLER